ncbi:hypothetical protein MPER_12323 [Moniliophthora perniciosa FA553]|nr:hypothetical protein MPER_12323 [Moniliophthora perniciosa FA553]
MIKGINSDNAIGPSGEVFYIPDFLTEEEEEYVMRKVQIMAIDYHIMRLTGVASLDSGKCPDIISRLRDAGIFATSPHGMPNHIILNEVRESWWYKPEENCDGAGKDLANESEGQPIDPKPALSVLLEPRSVIVTTGSFYRSHLHGIDEVSEDLFTKGDGATGPQIQGMGVEIANWKLVSGSKFKDAFRNGGALYPLRS